MCVLCLTAGVVCFDFDFDLFAVLFVCVICCMYLELVCCMCEFVFDWVDVVSFSCFVDSFVILRVGRVQPITMV